MDATTLIWSLFGVFLTGLVYIATFTLVGGLVWRLIGYTRTPAPLPVPITPAPTTKGGALARILGDVIIFPNLFKADKALWVGAFIFHHILFAVLFRHLRYLTYPVPKLVLYMEPVGLIFGYIFGLSILYLLVRRLTLPRTLYISNVPDYFVLVLLGGIAGTGILISYWLNVNLVDVKAYILGLMTLNPVAPPQHPLFLLHLFLVSMLMMYFPFSKLLHAGGVFFSPTRAQPYQVQTLGKRYINPLESQTQSPDANPTGVMLTGTNHGEI